MKRLNGGRRSLLRLEALEARWCPASTVLVDPGDPSTLVIRGDKLDNVVEVTGDATGVTVTVDGVASPTPFTGITHLNVHLDKGNDSLKVTYAAGVTDSALKVDVQAGDGDDTVTTDFGALTNANLFVRGNLGKGNDSFSTTLTGAVTGTTNARFKLKGHHGTDTFNVVATGVDVGADARLAFNLDGGKDADVTTVAYDGLVEGVLAYRDKAQHGLHTSTANLTLAAGSTGAVNARVDGGKDNDALTLNVNLASALDTATINALLDGKQGTDTAVVTTNVVVRRCEA